MAQKYANTKDKNILAVEYARYVLRHNTGTLNDYLEGTVFPFIINPVQRLEILDLIYIILSGFGSDYQALDCENINKLNHV